MKKMLFLIVLLMTITTILHAEDKLSIGLGWPYASVKYNLSPRFASEVRYATGDGIRVYAGRFYWNFYRPKNTKIFTGLESGYIDFNSLDTKGTGYEGSVFIGGEYFITKKLSFMLDFDPTYIFLKSEGVGVNGVEWLVNLAVHYYIF